MTDLAASKRIARALVDELHPTAAALVTKGIEHPPMLVIQPTAAPVLVALPIDSARKDAAAALHRECGLRYHAAALAIECWMKDPATLARTGEGIMFNVYALGVQWLAMCQIDRTARTLAPAELFNPAGDPSGNSATGRFVGPGYATQNTL